MKKLIALTLTLVMVLSFLPIMAGAAEPLYTDKADILKDLGLFKGTSNGYELDRVPTRMEASVMLVRLLGKETEVLAGTYAHPFTDVPEWADKYAGYMFEQGLTKGMSETIYGTDVDCEAKMYITFVLRALGFDDSARDFTYDDSITFAKTIGLISNGYKSNLELVTFKRDDMVIISYRALLQSLSNSDICLLEKLIQEGAVDSAKAMPYVNIYKYDNMMIGANRKLNSTSSVTIEGSETYDITINSQDGGIYKYEFSESRVHYSNTDMDMVSSVKYYSNGQLTGESTVFYTGGYLYNVAQKTKTKRTVDELYGRNEDIVIDFGIDDLPGVVTVISPMIDERLPKNITTDTNGNTIITFIESGKTNSAKRAALNVLKDFFYDDFTDAEYEEATVTLTDISVTEKINSIGAYCFESRAYTITAYIGGEKITMNYTNVFNIPSAGQEITVDLPPTAGYKEV